MSALPTPRTGPKKAQPVPVKAAPMADVSGTENPRNAKPPTPVSARSVSARGPAEVEPAKLREVVFEFRGEEWTAKICGEGLLGATHDSRVSILDLAFSNSDGKSYQALVVARSLEDAPEMLLVEALERSLAAEEQSGPASVRRGS